MKKESTASPWLKGMTAQEFELWWLEGQLAKEWFHLNDSQRAKAAEVKSLFKTIVTGDNLDRGLIFGLISLAHNLSLELARRQAYLRGCNDARRELRAEFLQAIKTLKANPFTPPSLKTSLSLEVEPALATVKSMAKRQDEEACQEMRNAAVKTGDLHTFLKGLICLDSMPGKKHTRHLRNFFACLFAEYFKHKGGPSLVRRMIKFCFREQMSANAVRRARAAFDKSFPNWRDITRQLFKALKAPQVTTP